MLRAIKHFLPDLRDHHVLVQAPTTQWWSFISTARGLRLRPLYKLVGKAKENSSLRAVHLNMGADILSRQALRAGEWMLHPEVVKQMWRVLGQA